MTGEPRTITDEMLRDQSNRIDSTLDDIAAHIPGALAEAEARGRSLALSEVEAAVDRMPLYDERDRIVTTAGDTRELRTMADAAEAIKTRVLAAITALREGTKA